MSRMVRELARLTPVARLSHGPGSQTVLRTLLRSLPARPGAGAGTSAPRDCSAAAGSDANPPRGGEVPIGTSASFEYLPIPPGRKCAVPPASSYCDVLIERLRG